MVYKLLFKYAIRILGHNIPYDLHMQDNINEKVPYLDKIEDTMTYIRLGHDALVPKEGGPPLDLKGYASRYITKRARNFQDDLKNEQKILRSKNTHLLKSKLKDFKVPSKFKVTGTERRWTKKMIDTFFKDKLNDIEDLPKEIQTTIREWKENKIDPDNYQNLNRAKVTIYAHHDVIYTLMIWVLNYERLIERGQEETRLIEKEATVSIYEMQKTGVWLDLEKTREAKQIMKIYIKKLREELVEIMGEPVKAGQHELIKQLFFTKFKIDLPDTTKETLAKLVENDDTDPIIVRLCKIIKELRSNEKWYSTYIVRWLEEAEKYNTDKIYPTYKQMGTVTGRVSSPFQQFPKKPKLDLEGNYLFHPRELFVIPKDSEYEMFFFDYSAMEMRIQAIYTILIGSPDINLCRAFIPLQCHDKNGKIFDIEKDDPYALRDEHPKNTSIEDLLKGKWSSWIDPVTNDYWLPTDIHSLTTSNALGISPDTPGFKIVRQIGKTANFAIIYGATANTLKGNLGIDMERARAFYNGFFKTFPGVRVYADYVRMCINTYGYAENLMGRKYYGVNAHKAKNYLIQGTGADYTKKLLPEIIALLKNKKSKIQGYLHDEFSFLIHKKEKYLIAQIKQIMEQLESPIPMLVDVEISTTNWKDKVDYHVS